MAAGDAVVMSQILTQPQPGPILSQPVQVTVMGKPLQLILPAVPIILEENTEDIITNDNPIPDDTPCSTVCQDACASPSLCSSLSPLANIFTPLLYPPGEDKFGRPVFTEENAPMQLGYFEEISDTGQEEPAAAASPDLQDVKKLPTFRIKLTDGEDFLDRVLPASGTSFTVNEEFSSA